MSIWQFMAAVDGVIAANSPEEERLSPSQVDELWEWVRTVH